MALQVVYTPIPESIEDLWQLAPEDFNRWRMQNDLPLLFDFLSKLLPGFNDWLKENSLTIEDLILVTPTGDLFKNKAQKESFYTIYEKKYPRADRKTAVAQRLFGQEMNQYYNFLKTLPQQSIKKAVISRHPNEFINSDLDYGQIITILEQKPFIPYFNWVKTRYKKDASEFKNDNGTWILDIGGWCAPDMAKESRAFLCGYFQLLKLGPSTLHAAIGNNRNLDFVDLDHTTICWLLNGLNISFSSCRKLTIAEAKFEFSYLFSSNIDQLRVNNSSLKNIKFTNCNGNTAVFENSRLFLVGFEKTAIDDLDFFKCNLNQIKYLEDERRRGIVAENLRCIRTVLQNTGNREEARDFYYKERCNEREIYYSLFKKINRMNCYAVTDNFKYSWRWMLSAFENILWGYGEKPSRTMLCSGMVITTFSILYFLFGHSDLGGKWLESFYFSVVTFTTLGDGDITPKNSGVLKFLVGLEALSGAFLMGLFVAGFSNRSRY